MDIPTNFTPHQLDILRQLVAAKHAEKGGTPGNPVDVELHHLQYKLDDYSRNASAAIRSRMAASA